MPRRRPSRSGLPPRSTITPVSVRSRTRTRTRQPGRARLASGAGTEGGFADDLPPQTADGDTLDTFDDLGLATIETKDLLSGADEAAPMLPSAQQRGFAGWAKGRKTLNLEGPGYERFLLPACFVLAGLVVLLLAFLLIRMVLG